MNFFEVNREERHFGFLFMTAILTYPEFRKVFFKLLNERTGLTLDPNDFEVYAEPAIFRDYWYDLGNHNNYDKELKKKREEMLKKFLNAIAPNKYFIANDKYDFFMTKKKGVRKLWFPGKWATNKIREIEQKNGVEGKILMRIKWLCNAKPDLMIRSKKNLLLIEIKVESKMGSTKVVYDKINPNDPIIYNQKATQEDILKGVHACIDGMSNPNLQRIDLNNEKNDNEGNYKFYWKEIQKQLEKPEVKDSIADNDLGFKLIKTHLDKMLENYDRTHSSKKSPKP